MFDLQLAVAGVDAPQFETLKTWVEAVFRHEKHPGQALTIRIVDTAEMTALNQAYRHKPGPTNVLSFAAEWPAEVTETYLGDIVICAPVVAAEAVAQNKALSAHWAHMLVHGLLHLLGYDHQQEIEAQIMETREREILQSLGYADPYLETPSSLVAALP